MCLAVPGKLIEVNGDAAVVDLQGSRLAINKLLTPEAAVGDWVLVHAGFAIAPITERDALETWDYLREAYDGEARAEAGLESAPQESAHGPRTG